MERVSVLLCCLAFAGSPALAQDVRANAGPGGLIEDGARRVIEGLIGRVAPQLRDLQERLAEFAPALETLAGQVDDWRAYAPPVMLPNGDILMRRRAPLPRAGPKPEPREEGGPIDL